MTAAIRKASERQTEVESALVDLMTWFTGKVHGIWVLPVEADDAVEKALEIARSINPDAFE